MKETLNTSQNMARVYSAKSKVSRQALAPSIPDRHARRRQHHAIQRDFLHNWLESQADV